MRSPNECRHCSSSNVKSNGWKGQVHQFHCNDCGKSWTFSAKWFVGRSGRGFRPPSRRIIGALALCSLGIPRRQVEVLTKVKSETAYRHLKRIEAEACGDELAHLLEDQFGCETVPRSAVTDLLLNVRLDQSRQESALFRGRFRIYSEEKQQLLLAKVARITGFPVSYDGENFKPS